MVVPAPPPASKAEAVLAFLVSATIDHELPRLGSRLRHIQCLVAGYDRGNAGEHTRVIPFMDWFGNAMNRARWIAVVSLAALGCAAVAFLLFKPEEDPCLSRGGEPLQMHERNPYLFSCGDAIYLPAPNSKARYQRVEAVRASEIEVLPFKYLRKADQLYFVALINEGWDEDAYTIRVIDGVDLATLEITAERRIQDRNAVYFVLYNGVLAEPRKDK